MEGIRAELHSIVSSLDWREVGAEVGEEGRRRIAIVGLPNAGKSTLFNTLKGWEVSPPAMKIGESRRFHEEDMGLFLLVDLPSAPEGEADYPLQGGWDELGFGLSDLADVDLIVFLLDGAAELRPVDFRWFSRLRSLGRPILPVLNKADLLARRGERLVRIERRLGTRVVPISALDENDVLEGLVPRMLELCPELAIPLGREIAPVRRRVARRLIRQAAAICALLGAEPLPLLDIPFQLLTQMRLVARLAVLYGYAPPGNFQKEMLAALAGGLGMRYLAQGVAKAVPLLGWVASGLLAAGGTWLLGQAAMAYFEHDASLDFKGRLAEPFPQVRFISQCLGMGRCFPRLRARAKGIISKLTGMGLRRRRLWCGRFSLSSWGRFVRRRR